MDAGRPDSGVPHGRRSWSLKLDASDLDVISGESFRCVCADPAQSHVLSFCSGSNRAVAGKRRSRQIRLEDFRGI